MGGGRFDSYDSGTTGHSRQRQEGGGAAEEQDEGIVTQDGRGLAG